jgi:hypothetical protein
VARIFLHIGTEKTGTTTLQAFLTANEAALARSGLTYLSDQSRPYFERIAHGPLAACLMAERAEFISGGKHQPAEFVLDVLRRDIDRSGRDVILSCEQFSSRITSAASLRRLADALADHDVTIVCYLRRQDELAIAAYTTAVRCGRQTRLSIGEIVDGGWYYDFRRMLSLWAVVFGAENLIVRPYDVESLHGQDIRRDFLRLVGIDGASGFTFGEDRNRSLDARQVEMLRLLNQTLPCPEDDGPHAFERANRLRDLVDAHLPRGEPLCQLLGAAERRAIVARYDEGNREIEATYMPPGSLANWFAPVAGDEGVAIRPVEPIELAAVATSIAAHLADRTAEVEGLRLALQRPRRRNAVSHFIRSVRRTAALSVLFALLLDPMISLWGVMLDFGAAEAFDLAQMLN